MSRPKDYSTVSQNNFQESQNQQREPKGRFTASALETGSGLLLPALLVLLIAFSMVHCGCLELRVFRIWSQEVALEYEGHLALWRSNWKNVHKNIKHTSTSCCDCCERSLFTVLVVNIVTPVAAVHCWHCCCYGLHWKCCGCSGDSGGSGG